MGFNCVYKKLPVGFSFFHLNYFLIEQTKQAEWMSGWAHWVCLQQPGKLKYDRPLGGREYFKAWTSHLCGGEGLCWDPC